MNVVWEHLLPAVVDGDVSSDAPPALQQLRDKLSALSLPVQSGSTQSSRMMEVSGKRYSFEGAPRGLLAAQLDFAGETPVLIVENADGLHSIRIGVGEWLRGTTGYRKRINDLFDVEEQGIAATGGWLDENTYAVKLCFNETPNTMTMSFAFGEDELVLDRSYNVRWGNTSEPQLTGTPAP